MRARVPLVMQLEATECGAACLAMVCAYYRKRIPLSQVRVDCGVGRDGSSALALVQTARRYGFEVESISCDLAYLHKQVAPPAILHWGFDHFVVLTGWQGSKALLNDPAVGKVKVPMDVVGRKFTGVCLICRPGASFVADGKRSVGFPGRFLARSPLLTLAMLAALLAALLGLAVPALQRWFFDGVLGAPAEDGSLSRYIVWFLAVIVFQTIASLLARFFARRYTTSLQVLGSVRLMWRCLHLPLSFFAQRYPADISSRLEENEEVVEAMAEWAVPLFVNGCMAVVYLACMASYGPALTLVAVGASVVLAWCSAIGGNRRLGYAQTMTMEENRLRMVGVDAVSLIGSIKALGAEDVVYDRWSDRRAALTRTQVRYAPWDLAFQSLLPLVRRAALLGVLVLGTGAMMEGGMSLGMVMAFQSFLNQFLDPIERMGQARGKVHALGASMDRVADLADYPLDPAVTDHGEGGAEKLRGDIAIHGLVFGYNRLQPPIIDGLDLEVKAGTCLGIVGPSGSGKSTLGRLLLGLYLPWNGSIRFDGKERSAWPRGVLTASIGVVGQDVVMFPGTLMENLKLWDGTISDEDVVQAAKDAWIHDEIMAREGGYYCRVDQNGRNFSGGQLQRFEIARVLALKPSVLLLDEATSALDVDTELRVMESIRARGVTTIVVSHRYGAISRCDEIVVLDHGAIVDRGTHDQLFRKGGLYSRLVTMG